MDTQAARKRRPTARAVGAIALGLLLLAGWLIVTDRQQARAAEAVSRSAADPLALPVPDPAAALARAVTAGLVTISAPPAPPGTPAAHPATYVVRTGDSLPDIAHALYGDATLSGVIARTNQARVAAGLIPGQALLIPAP